MKRYGGFVVILLFWLTMLVGRVESGVIVGEERPMTVADVLRLLKVHIGEEVIIEQIDATRSIFTLSTEDLVELKKAGASDRLLRVMIRTGEAPSGTSSYRVVTPSGRVEYHYRAGGMGYPIVVGPAVYPAVSPVVIYGHRLVEERRGYQVRGRVILRRGGYHPVRPMSPYAAPHIIIRGTVGTCR
jgi:hypothetical protein